MTMKKIVGRLAQLNVQIYCTDTLATYASVLAEGQEECEHAFDKRLAIAKELKIGRFI